MSTTIASANKVGKSVNRNANEVSKSATASDKTQRVLETREQWAVIFNHCVSLVVALAKGEALPANARDGFAFGKVATQPHSRQYAQSLIGGFVSRKAGKFFAQTEGLKSAEAREKIALAILVGTKLGGSDAAKAKAILSKAEPKQAKTFAEAVLNAVQGQSDAVPPTEEKPAAKGTSPKGKKAEAKAQGKRGGKRGGAQKAAAKA